MSVDAYNGLSLYAFMIGSCVGSFLYSVDERASRGESIIRPGSRCTSCLRQLPFWEVIPLCSWIICRGHCTQCKQPISCLHPLWELLTGLTYTMIVGRYGLSSDAVIGLVASTWILMITASDLRSLTVPNRFVFPGIFVTVAMEWGSGNHSFWSPIEGGGVCFVVLWAIALASRGGLGGGDVKLYALVGAWLGPVNGILSLVVASAAGALIGILITLSGRWGQRLPLPFVPFIYVGTMVCYLYGDVLWACYRSWITT